MSDGLHVTHGLKLGPKIGPLPAGAWVLVLVAGVYVGHKRGQRASTDAAPAPDTGSDTATGSDLSPDAGGSLHATGLPDGSGDYGNQAGAPITNIYITSPPAPKPAPVPVRTPAPLPIRYYTVVKGDTLAIIARKFRTTPLRLYTVNKAVIEAAARAHHLANSANGAHIFPGTRLVIR